MFTILSLLGSCIELALFFIVIATVYYILRYLWELIPLDNIKNRAVFITGCDSGFGHEVALKCAKNGIPVFAGCYTEEGQKNLEKEASGYTGKLHSVPLDVTKDESIQNAFEYVKTHLEPGQKLWAILNNAGTATSCGPDEWTSLEQYKISVDINTYGMIRVVHTFLPLLKESKGRVLTTTSVLARLANVYNGPYNISKWAAEAYMDTIRRELKPWGIKCCIFNPGAFMTPLQNILPTLTENTWKNLTEEQKNEYGAAYKQDLMDSFREGLEAISSRRVDYVADAYYHAITARFPRLRYRIGWDAMFYYIPLSFLPTELQDWISGKFRNALCTTLPTVLQKDKNQ